MTLQDDVATVILTLDDADMEEANQGSGGFTVTRDNHGNINEGINVFVEVSGSATINGDYTVQNLLQSSNPIWYVHIPGGQASVSVILTPIKDSVIEGDETLVFSLRDSVAGHGDFIVGDQTSAEMTIFDLVDKIFIDGFEEELVTR